MEKEPTAAGAPPGSKEGAKDGAKPGQGGFSAWLKKGNNKEIAIGGGLVLAYALYTRMKSTSSGSSTSTKSNTTASTPATPAAYTTSGSDADTTLNNEVASLAAQVQALQSSQGSGPSGPGGGGTPPGGSSSGSSPIQLDLYRAEQAEASGNHAAANTWTHRGWAAAGRPKGLPIFQLPYPAVRKATSSSKKGA
ncbi:MAG: hypothetical protein ACYDDZ_10970 [Acidimicrobiales bacterium]